MAGFKQISCVVILVILSGLATAQNNTNSPYTRYGYGDLSPQTSGKSRGMGGTAYALRDGSQVNALNPASYTMVDSLTFIFDAGLSIQNMNLSDGVTKKNVGNSSLDYVTMQFRLHPRLGMTMGFLPYSNIGYSFVKSDAQSETPNYTEYSGDGGLHQAFVGLGFKVFNNLSVGVNASYFWGDITRSDHLGFAAANNREYWRERGVSISDFKVDFGVQYTQRLSKKSELTVGAVFSPKINLNNDAYLQTQTAMKVSNSDGSQSYTDYQINRTDYDTKFGLPMNIGAGVAYVYDKQLTVAADYTMQQWSKVKYWGKNDFYDMHKIALGMEYLPSYTGRSYFSLIKYRVGGYYSTPYYKVRDSATKDYYRASSEYGLTAGVTLPLPRTRSMLTLSAQYVNVTGKRVMMDEKYMRLCIGITFNERWFFKRKVD